MVETITASVIILIVFSMALFLLNNLFVSTLRAEETVIFNKLNELQYQYTNSALAIPFQEDYKDWDIQVLKEEEGTFVWVVFTATNITTSKNVIKKRLYVAP